MRLRSQPTLATTATDSVRRILMLGRLRAFRSESEIHGLAAQPLRSAVLAYIAASEEVTRDTLLGTFWPERTESRARHALSQVLHKLRRNLGAQWLKAEGEVLQLASWVEVDAREFERAVQLHEHDAALRLYRGPFLDGFPLRGTHEFELWLDAERGRLARLHASSCLDLARQKEDLGDLDGAIVALRRVSQSDPFDEAAHSEIVRLLLSCGRRSEALRLNREFLNRITAEQIEPSAALVRRLDKALQSSITEPIASGQHALSGGRSARERILVMPFENLTGEPSLEPLGRMAAEWITEGLDRAGIGMVVPLLDELRLLHAGRTEGSDAPVRMRDLGRAMGAGTLVVGTYYRMAAALEIRAQVVDLERDDLLGAIEPVRITTDEEHEGLLLLRERVLGLVAAALDTEWTALPTSPEFGLPPPTYSAYTAYSTGLDHFIRDEFAKAIPWFEQTIRLDPEFKRPVFLSAAAHINLGDWPSAARLIASLGAVRKRLSPYEQHSLQWHELNLAGDLFAAYEFTSRNWRHYPGTLAQFIAALDAVRVNRPAEAIQILRGLEPTRGWLRHFYAYWDLITSAYHLLGDHAVELAHARRGREHGPTRYSLLACEVRALAATRMSPNLEHLLAEAAALPPQAGWSISRIMLLAASELRAHGDSAAARELAERAVRNLNDDVQRAPFAAPALSELARALYLAERHAEAEEIFAALAAEFPQNVEYRGRLTSLGARRGDRAAAARGDEELRQLSHPYVFGRTTAWRARVAALLGDPERAIRLLMRAFAEGQPYGADLHTDVDLEPLRSNEVFRRWLKPKG